MDTTYIIGTIAASVAFGLFAWGLFLNIRERSEFEPLDEDEPQLRDPQHISRRFWGDERA